MTNSNRNVVAQILRPIKQKDALQRLVEVCGVFLWMDFESQPETLQPILSKYIGGRNANKPWTKF